MENIEHPTPINREQALNAEHGMSALSRDAATGEGQAGRLSVQTVEHLHRLLGGEARVEEMVLRFIADRYGTKSLLHLPPHVVKEIIKRPGDFIRATKNFCEPELNF